MLSGPYGDPAALWVCLTREDARRVAIEPHSRLSTHCVNSKSIGRMLFVNGIGRQYHELQGRGRCPDGRGTLSRVCYTDPDLDIASAGASSRILGRV